VQTTIDQVGATWIGQELERVGLNYTVHTEPCKFDGMETGEDFWSYRVWPDGTREPIKPVGKDFRPLQNHVAFDFMERLVRGGDLEIEKYRDYRKGKAMIVKAKILGDMPLSVASEPIDESIYFINGHDGHTVAGACFAPERLWCGNQLVFTFPKDRDAPSHTFKIRHTKNAGARLGSALQAMQKARPYYQHVTRLGERLAAKRIKTRDAERMFRQLVPTPDTPGRGRTIAENKRAEIVDVWRTSENLNNVRFTLWGWLNGVVEWNDHYRSYRNEDVQFDAIFRGRNLYRGTREHPGALDIACSKL
jgi:phage/plasmid-like protein (TIGR03299 family)